MPNVFSGKKLIKSMCQAPDLQRPLSNAKFIHEEKIFQANS